MELIELVERTDLPLRITLRQLGTPPRTLYGSYAWYLGGVFCFARQEAAAASEAQQVPEKVRADMIDLASKKTELDRVHPDLLVLRTKDKHGRFSRVRRIAKRLLEAIPL